MGLVKVGGFMRIGGFEAFSEKLKIR